MGSRFSPSEDVHYLSFHSISFPSEWGVSYLAIELRILLLVSIQLVSPASGEASIKGNAATAAVMFPFN